MIVAAYALGMIFRTLVMVSLVVVASMTVSACQSAPAASDAVASTASAANHWQGVAFTTDRRYVVEYETKPAPIPLNRIFSLTARVYDGRTFDVDAPRPTPLRDAILVIDAGMPEHNHGMNRNPRITRNDDGSFTAAGMLFHMPGRWALYFDITRGGIIDRAEASIELD